MKNSQRYHLNRLADNLVTEDRFGDSDNPYECSCQARCASPFNQPPGCAERMSFPTKMRRFAREDIQRMRNEMLTQFAPTTELMDDAPEIRAEFVNGDEEHM